MNDAPCRDCASREVGCHAGFERSKAYAEQRERVRQNRQDFIIERTTNESRQQWWLKFRKKTRKGG